MELSCLPEAEVAERCVLGRCVDYAECVSEAISMLVSDDFDSPMRATLFDVIVALATAGSPVCRESIQFAMAKIGQFSTQQVDQELIECFDSTACAANMGYFCNAVAECSRIRRLKRGASELSAKRIATLQEASDEIDGLMRAVAYDDIARPKHIREIVRSRYATIERHAEGLESLRVVWSGLTALDRHLGGFGNGELIVIAARPGAGKSSLALSLAEHASRRGKVLVFELEMSEEQLADRFLSSGSGVPVTNLRRAIVGQGQWNSLQSAVRSFEDADMFVVEKPALRINEIIATAERAALSSPLGLVIVDYLQLVRASTRSQSRETEIAEVSRGLKALAKKINAPVVALSALNRAIEQRPKGQRWPVLSDIRESGAIEQDADMILFLHRDALFDDSADASDAWIVIGKNRQGDSGKVQVRWNGAQSRFEDR